MVFYGIRHKSAYNRTFPYMEANYTYAIKNQRGASKIPRNECEELEGRRREGRGEK